LKERASRRPSVLCSVVTLALVAKATAAVQAQSMLDPERPTVTLLTFVVRGLRNDRGHVRGALYSSRDGWGDERRASSTCEAPIYRGEARCRLEVRPGRHAFAFAHDEDDDGHCNRDWLGIPHEGYGFANDVRPVLSIPSWESASVSVEAGLTERVVRTRYGI
jgi:uncharacterized protein (DUF2141 family)